MISAQVASKMKGCLVSFIAIFLVISLEMMEGAEGKPQPGPEPEPQPGPQPLFRKYKLTLLTSGFQKI